MSLSQSPKLDRHLVSRKMREADWNGTPDGISNQSDCKGVVMATSNANKLFSEFKSAKDFDAEVKRLRAEGVEPKDLSHSAVRLKSHCTPLQWAGKLEYQNQRKNRPGIRERDNNIVRAWKKRPGIQQELNRRERERLRADEGALERKRTRNRLRMKALRSQGSELLWDNRPENKQKMRQYYREYNVQRRKDDPTFLLVGRLRSRLYSACQEAASPRYWSAAWTGLETCGLLRDYIESHFVEGMSWDNRTEWHIDHLMPLRGDVVDLHNIAHQAAVCHYSNLLPVWGPENLKKKNTYTAEAKANFLRLVKQYESIAAQEEGTS